MTPALRTIPLEVNLIELHQAYPQRYPHLLQSTAHGRYDILFAFPGESLMLDSTGSLYSPDNVTAQSNDFLECFDRWWDQAGNRQEPHADLPFTGGWFVYLGYELAGQIEPRLLLPPPATELPVAMATRFTCAIVFDHRDGTTAIVSEPDQAARVQQIETDIAALSAAAPDAVPVPEITAVDEAPAQGYLDAIARIHTYIREGDVFQVNLSRRWDIHYRDAVDRVALYRNLGIHNPAPFSGLISCPEAAIISSSPERLVSVRGRHVETRPIAGTRPRSAAAAADRAHSRELLAHPKEQAEHIMLIDLERNDLGRICVPGSIAVNELMVLESYAHVHHIVSNVRGQLRDSITPGEVIRAVFPGGTITGCPKVRCMEIIAELEQEARGAYTGSAGYINLDGSMDLNILIRSMTCSGNRVQFRAGAGIVADSVAAAELAETRAKARGLLHALGVADA
ncbi:MAG: aminodeoxychorismate synthase component I [Gammaproteobacteria bacterium]